MLILTLLHMMTETNSLSLCARRRTRHNLHYMYFMILREGVEKVALLCQERTSIDVLFVSERTDLQKFGLISVSFFSHSRHSFS